MIELKNDYLTVKFKTRGGEITSIKNMDKVEYLWQGDSTYWGGQAPVLFPICGSVRDDKTIFHLDDKSTILGSIPRHGLVRKKDFDYKILSDNKVEFSIKSNEEMFNNYPYDFLLRVLYTLNKNEINVEYFIKNNSKYKMPYFIGAHPGFNCPLLEGESYTDYYLEFEKEETCTIPSSFPETGLLYLKDRSAFLDKTKILPLNYDLFKKDAITLDELKSRTITLKSKKNPHFVKVSFSDFDNIILWSTINKGPFIAIEPWSGLSTSLEESDNFVEKRNVSYVEPLGEAKKMYSIKIG